MQSPGPPPRRRPPADHVAVATSGHLGRPALFWGESGMFFLSVCRCDLFPQRAVYTAPPCGVAHGVGAAHALLDVSHHLPFPGVLAGIV